MNDRIRELIAKVALAELKDYDGSDCSIWVAKVHDGHVTFTDYMSNDEINYAICHGCFDLSYSDMLNATCVMIFVGHGYKGEPDDVDVTLCKTYDDAYDWLAETLSYGYGVEMFEGTAIYDELKEALGYESE